MGHRYRQVIPQHSTISSLKVVYDDGELRIEGLDRHSSPVIALRFVDVLLTRVVEEGVRLHLITDRKREHGFMLRDEQSELITWVREEGLNTRDLRDAKHFVVFAGREIIDVVTFSDPEISYGDSPRH